MIISRNERTPEYFGCIAKKCGLSFNWNPYVSTREFPDARHNQWIAGHTSGELEDKNI